MSDFFEGFTANNSKRGLCWFLEGDEGPSSLPTSFKIGLNIRIQSSGSRNRLLLLIFYGLEVWTGFRKLSRNSEKLTFNPDGCVYVRGIMPWIKLMLIGGKVVKLPAMDWTLVLQSQ